MFENNSQTKKPIETYVISNNLVKTSTETHVIESLTDNSSILLYINGWNTA